MSKKIDTLTQILILGLISKDVLCGAFGCNANDIENKLEDFRKKNNLSDELFKKLTSFKRVVSEAIETQYYNTQNH